MSQRIVLRFHLDTRNRMDSIAAEKGWKTPYLVSKIIEETIPAIDVSSYKIVKDEYRNLKKGIRETTATKQMSVFLSDYAIETINEIAENHRDRTVFPSTVVRDIVVKWLETH